MDSQEYSPRKVFLMSMIVVAAIVLGVGWWPRNKDRAVENVGQTERGNSRSEESSSGEQLIKGLISHNSVPRIGRGFAISNWISWPDSYSIAEQQRVYACYTSLLDREAKAFSNLISHLNDKEYSLTILFDGDYYNYSVGLVCSRALRTQLDCPHLQHIMVHGPKEYYETFSYVHNVIGTGENARKWAADHHGKLLVDLQIEAIQWLLNGAKQIDGSKPPSIEMTEPSELERLLQELRQTRKPIRLPDPGARPPALTSRPSQES